MTNIEVIRIIIQLANSILNKYGSMGGREREREVDNTEGGREGD